MPNRPKPRLLNWLGILLFVLILGWAFSGSQFNFSELVSGAPRMVDMLNRSLPPDATVITDAKRYSFPEELSMQQLLLPVPMDSNQAEIKSRWWNNTFPQTVLGATLQTIQMAIAGTVLAVIFALPLSFIAARNTTPHILLYHLTKIIINFFRTIPDFAVGLILIAAIGLGPFAGTLALSFHTTMVLIKLFSEAIENIDQGVVEAISATGARFVQVISFAVIPQVIPEFISLTLYRFETNIRAATILGLIGAGGIGLIMNSDFRMFQYPQAAVSVIVLIVLVMIVDYSSAQLRKFVI